MASRKTPHVYDKEEGEGSCCRSCTRSIQRVWNYVVQAFRGKQEGERRNRRRHGRNAPGVQVEGVTSNVTTNGGVGTAARVDSTWGVGSEERSRSLGLPLWPAKRFTFQKVLGKGSFGTVILASDNMEFGSGFSGGGGGDEENGTDENADGDDMRSPHRMDTARKLRESGREGSLKSLSSLMPNSPSMKFQTLLRRGTTTSSAVSSSSVSRALSETASSMSASGADLQWYAVKRIAKKRLSNRAFLDVKKEIDIHQALGKSINIVYVYGAYEDAKYVYIVLELCTGGVLYKRIKQGNYSEATAAGYVRSMLRVLAQCHSRGVVHRDLKPDNFLFLNDHADSPLKATDFGLATYFEEGATLHDVTGTPFYMAPEVVMGEYAKEVDLWSLGVITYQLLTGKLPFTHDPKVRGREASIQVLRAVLHQKIDIESSPLFENISAPAKHFVSRLLQRDPRARLTVEEALAHEWVRSDGVAPTYALSASIVQRLQHFGTYSWLKQRALLSIVAIMHESPPSPSLALSRASTATSSQTTGAAPLVNDTTPSMSSDSSSSATKKHPHAIFSRSASAVTWGDDDDDELIDEFAPEQDGFAGQADEIADMFQRIDADKDGNLDLEEMKKAMQTMDFRLSEPEIEQLFNEMDVDRSGAVDKEEFTAVLCNWALVSKTKHWKLLVRRVFDDIDYNGDGSISVHELTKMFRDTTGEEDDDFATAVAESLVNQVDLNNDGEIDFDEFLELLEASTGDLSMFSTAKSFNKTIGSKTLNHIRRKHEA